ncbi:MAG: hypothetical protein AAFX58_03570 [Pseudomonadota bacterium]
MRELEERELADVSGGMSAGYPGDDPGRGYDPWDLDEEAWPSRVRNPHRYFMQDT